MLSNPLGDEIDKRIIQRMTADEQQRTEALAARFRERLAVWTKRIKVFSGDRLFEYRFIFQGHGISLFESQEHAHKYIYDAKIDGFPVKYTKEMQL